MLRSSNFMGSIQVCFLAQKIQLSNQENRSDLGSGGTGRRQLLMTSSRCIPITHTKGCSAVVLCMRVNTYYFLLCSIWLQLCISLTSVLLQTARLTERVQR
jgi:hypothetical protein